MVVRDEPKQKEGFASGSLCLRCLKWVPVSLGDGRVRFQLALGAGGQRGCRDAGGFPISAVQAGPNAGFECSPAGQDPADDF